MTTWDPKDGPFITITSEWAQSPASRLFTHAFIQVQIKENIKAPRHWPLCGEFTGDRWIPRTKGQYRGKCFHLMMSSCTLLFKSNGIFLRWQNMVFIFKVQFRNFVCDIRRSFAFTLDTPRLGEHPNLVRFEKRAVKTLQHEQIYSDVFLFHEMTNTYEWWSAIIDTNYIL